MTTKPLSDAEWLAERDAMTVETVREWLEEERARGCNCTRTFEVAQGEIITMTHRVDCPTIADD